MRRTKNRTTVLEWLQSGKHLTNEFAREHLGVSRLWDVIRALQGNGERIEGGMMGDYRKKVKEYWMLH